MFLHVFLLFGIQKNLKLKNGDIWAASPEPIAGQLSSPSKFDLRVGESFIGIQKQKSNESTCKMHFSLKASGPTNQRVLDTQTEYMRQTPQKNNQYSFISNTLGSDALVNPFCMWKYFLNRFSTAYRLEFWSQFR